MQKANIMHANSPEEMESSRAQPSSGAVVSAEKHPSSGPTEAPDQQNNATEKHTEGRKGHACFRTVRKAVKRHFHTLKSKVCSRVPDREPLQENPRTSRPEPTAVTDPLEAQPVLQHGAEYFRSLYEVGQQLGIEDHVYEGRRRSDGQQVLLKFAARRFPGRTLILNDFFRPLCREAFVMLELQRPPTTGHFVRLYDWFIMEEKDVMITEYPRSYVTLCEFVGQNRGRLNEEIARRIMLQLIVALSHCLERGVGLETEIRHIIINPGTLQIKLIDFSNAAYIPTPLYIPRRKLVLIIDAVKILYNVLDELIKGFSPQEEACLSKGECSPIRQQLSPTIHSFNSGRLPLKPCS
ncbi:hypothetical protein Q8A67_012321 [Cirrhinus molitorella]|uniref:non-specific serine/threonine protein kinase n=1 Tax=Cirrhinus molitorella TaxID=172907 RepID=A0AA88PPT8_9TELE|nr:hypothetical protein Q8A67_012321 [Cirrhinus molitorella]